MAELLGHLASQALNDIALPWGVEDELQMLKVSVSTTKVVLLDAEEKYHKNREVADWLQRLKDAFHEVEDLLDVEEVVSIIPIVGIRGLGKTTLAQCVFNDDTVGNHFEVKIWAYVSDMFDLRSIMRQIIEGGSDRDVQNLVTTEQLQTQLRQKIDGKNYSLILERSG